MTDGEPPVAGSQFTGTAINPARALGPAIVFHCRWNQVWLYVIAGDFVILRALRLQLICT